MDTLSIILQMILSLSILVVLHECGHFFPARWFKTKVEKFYLFFNPYFSLYKKQIGETEYGIGWVPFGGYVKIAGMIDESMDKEQMQGPPQPWEFRSKTAWQRFVIMVGGVTVNFILGFLIFAGMLFYFGKTYLPAKNITEGISVDSVGYAIGLRDGDAILKIGDQPFENFSPGAIIEGIVIKDAQTITVQRAGQEVAVPIDSQWADFLSRQDNKGWSIIGARIPAKVADVAKSSVAEAAGIQVNDQVIAVQGMHTPYFTAFQSELKKYPNTSVSLTLLRGADTVQTVANLGPEALLGIRSYGADHFYDVERKKYGFFEAIPAGINMGVDFLGKQLQAFGQMFKGRIKATESLGSVISITKLFDPSWSWERFWNITAMLSILLGFFNLLPIPALDGGYIMFLIYEMITGRKPSDKFMEYATLAGFIIMVSLMLFALGLDIKRLF